MRAVDGAWLMGAGTLWRGHGERTTEVSTASRKVSRLKAPSTTCMPSKPLAEKMPSPEYFLPPASRLRCVTARRPRFDRPRVRLAAFALHPTSSTHSSCLREKSLVTRAYQAAQRASSRRGLHELSRFVV